MDIHNCLNCSHPVSGNYCGNCGQKAATHRFSLKHILAHDIIHGIFHIDKGFFFTAREILVRPGASIREYVAGKRVNHFNAFTFIVLLVAVYHLLYASSGFKISELYAPGKNKTVLDELQGFLIKNYKFLAFGLIPVYASATFLVFRRAGQNFAEHMVMNVYRQGGELLMNILIFAVFLLFRQTSLAPYLFMALSFCVPVYNTWFYMQYFRRDYKSTYWLFQRTLLVQLMVSMVTSMLAYFFLQDFLQQHGIG